MNLEIKITHSNRDTLGFILLNGTYVWYLGLYLSLTGQAMQHISSTADSDSTQPTKQLIDLF